MPDNETGWDALAHAWRDVLTRIGWPTAVPDPATPEVIGAAEARLGVELPVELRELYAVADGLPALEVDVYGVRGCAELAWFRDVEAELIEIWDEIDRDDGEGTLREFIELMHAGLAVSKGGDEYRLFTVPTPASGAAHGANWQLYRQGNDGSGVIERGSLLEELRHQLRLSYDVRL